MNQDSARDPHAPQGATAGTSSDNRSRQNRRGWWGGRLRRGARGRESTDDASPREGIAADEAGGGAGGSPASRPVIDAASSPRCAATAWSARPRWPQRSTRCPRELFAPPGTPVEAAYADRVAVLAADAAGVPTSTLSQPSIVAIMLEQLDVHPGHRVLEIGTGSGYNTALLAELAGARGRVTSVEFDAGLVASAAARLAELGPGGGTPMDLRHGDGWRGCADGAPYDRIHATVGVDDIAPTWRTQLADGGLLVAPLWLRPGSGAVGGAAPRRLGPAQRVRRALRVPPVAWPARGRAACATAECRGDRPVGRRRGVVGDRHRDDRLLAGRKGTASGPVPDSTDRRWWALTLSEPRTVLFTDAHGAPAAWGAYDAEQAGLAIAIDGWLTSYGDLGVADDVMSRLADLPRRRPDRPGDLRLSDGQPAPSSAVARGDVADHPAGSHVSDPLEPRPGFGA
ncbi:protein-L-isoaspartate O-methyltransferase family protein [Yinghuangia aomiensis]